MQMKELIFDIETTTNSLERFEYWKEGPPVSENRPWIIFSIGYTYLDSKKVIVKDLTDFPLFKEDPLSDKYLVTWFHGILSTKANITVSYNGDRFDIKRLNTRFAVHGLPPVSEQIKNVDPIKTVSRLFAFNSKSLDYVCKQLGIGGKYTGDIKYYTLDKKALWMGVLKGDKKAYKILKTYNRVDVEKLKDLYVYLYDYIWARPLTLDNRRPCPFCKSYNTQSRGSGPYNGGLYKRHQCMDCAVNSEKSWFYGNKIINKPAYAHP